MKSFSVAAFFIGLIALAYCFSDEEMEMIKKMSEGCIAETGVAIDLVMKAKEGVFESDPKLQEYLFCMVKTPGFMNDAGEYQIDTMEAMIGMRMGADVAKQIIADCTKFGGDKLEKATEMAKCLHSKKA